MPTIFHLKNPADHDRAGPENGDGKCRFFRIACGSIPLFLLPPELICMGHYARGDVILASLARARFGIPKTRPAVVLGTGGSGDLVICPVSRKPSFDAPCIPLSLDDFAEGGLDLFTGSYVLVATPAKIKSRDVIGKKGRLTEESAAAIAARVSERMQTE
jgi:mRNA interferase MazF